MDENVRRGVFFEKNFDEIFGIYGNFFREQILVRGYHYLLPNDHYWGPHLVEEFYNYFD